MLIVSISDEKMFDNKVCSCCGKKFVPAKSHMYRANGSYQCGYDCYRKEGGDYGKRRYEKSSASVQKMRQKAKK